MMMMLWRLQRWNAEGGRPSVGSQWRQSDAAFPQSGSKLPPWRSRWWSCIPRRIRRLRPWSVYGRV